MDLQFPQKLGTLVKRAALNENIQVHSVHISLNFDPSENDMPRKKLREITDAYMQKIGFGGQPYLVYKHNDAGHPHLHVVTTNIKADGDYIRLHNIGRDVSEPARRAIEKEFNLVEAQSHHLQEAYELKPVNVQKVQYGKMETKRAITNVLDYVIPVYKYTSLEELNTVLQQYGVMADRGQKDGRIYKTNGLTYRLLDAHGQKVGKPIKASAIYNKPMLPFLEKKFLDNEPLRQKHKQRLKNTLALVFKNGQLNSLEDFTKALQKEKILPVFRLNEDGILYGATYIDQVNKTVFNGSDIDRDKSYSAAAIRQRFNLPMPAGKAEMQKHQAIPSEQKSQHITAAQQPEASTQVQKITAHEKQVVPLEQRTKHIPVEQHLMQHALPGAGNALKNIIKELMEPETQLPSGSSVDDERRKRKRKRLRI